MEPIFPLQILNSPSRVIDLFSVRETTTEFVRFGWFPCCSRVNDRIPCDGEKQMGCLAHVSWAKKPWKRSASGNHISISKVRVPDRVDVFWLKFSAHFHRSVQTNRNSL